MNKIALITDGKNRMEDAALQQLKKTAELPGILKAVGLPDLHPGKTPVGAVFFTEDRIYPHLIGNDIGCGMSLFKTKVEKRKLKREHVFKKAESIGILQQVVVDDFEEFPEDNPLGASLGTIGGGNHFAELQETDSIVDPELFNALGMTKETLFLLVHSGSRGYGQKILETFSSESDFYCGFSSKSPQALEYLALHQNALKWASVNRNLIARRMAAALGLGSVECRMDIPHNFLEQREQQEGNVWIHRKGAAPADMGPVIIPGSRGSLTYLVMPTDDTSVSGISLAHGAGRKWERGMCRGRLEAKHTRESLRQTVYKSRVICSDSAMLFEEAPEAYKNITEIIQVLETFNLIRVIATFKPILTYKG